MRNFDGFYSLCVSENSDIKRAVSEVNIIIDSDQYLIIFAASGCSLLFTSLQLHFWENVREFFFYKLYFGSLRDIRYRHSGVQSIIYLPYNIGTARHNCFVIVFYLA